MNSKMSSKMTKRLRTSIGEFETKRSATTGNWQTHKHPSNNKLMPKKQFSASDN